MVRGIGLIRGVKDIETSRSPPYNGTPVYLGNVASVQLGPEFRRGVLDKDGKEAVGGVVVIRYGANAREVIAAVKQKIAEIQPGLPRRREASFRSTTAAFSSITPSTRYATR